MCSFHKYSNAVVIYPRYSNTLCTALKLNRGVTLLYTSIYIT